MRCPDCNKFTGLETQEPEMNSIEASYSNESIEITCDGRTVRNCADCGTELKALDWDTSTDVDVDKLWECEAGKALTEEQRDFVKAALEDGTAEVSVEDNGTESDESGGGRYKKNIITSRVLYEITVKVNEVPGIKGTLELTYSDSVESQNAASEFEEQV